MSMASIRPVNRGDIAERFGAPPMSSGKGSLFHFTPQAESQKKTKKALGPATSRHSPSSAILPPQSSIQDGYGMDLSSSGTESRAGHVEPQVVENAPAESSPGTGSTSDNQTLRRFKEKITRMFRCSSS
ncbi:uncharacterized protein LOC110745050 isoform X2 [Prunus avium]|uniref:Uncharacterized protein LOC110745050 isoform X2 n=1 Tax=Prunus avium TaxID=42229 RepID=A0A6P5R7B3_PRUAV|nr:uncharacterized protein LOC110745050 isoform X2 [Prunus avium]